MGRNKKKLGDSDYLVSHTQSTGCVFCMKDERRRHAEEYDGSTRYSELVFKP